VGPSPLGISDPLQWVVQVLRSYGFVQRRRLGLRVVPVSGLFRLGLRFGSFHFEKAGTRRLELAGDIAMITVKSCLLILLALMLWPSVTLIQTKAKQGNLNAKAIVAKAAQNYRQLSSYEDEGVVVTTYDEETSGRVENSRLRRSSNALISFALNG
jgi:hypothetical protein